MCGKDEDGALLRRRKPAELGNHRKAIGLGERKVGDQQTWSAAGLEDSRGRGTIADQNGFNPVSFDSLTVDRRLLGVEFGDENVWRHLAG